ncbi:MAG: non-ribosomal peptide synthetase [Anaerolineaceae bacterium]|nr:non-ribosomal peptide synthetase [Anaerolineaceae bacterium]
MDKTLAANLEGLSAEEQRALLQKLLQEKKAKKADKTAVLSFGQERLWFLHQLDSANAAYNLRTAVRLQGSLNLPALEASIQAVVDRHESLRTRIVAVNGRPQQQIQQQMMAPLPITDLSHLQGDERETAVQQQTDAEAQATFDLANGPPLFRARLLKLQTNDHILLLTMHHIISDGWSIGILIREIATLYQTKVANQPSPLAKLPVQYADFATWQREWLQGETLEKQLAYWGEQLADTAVVDLPTDHPRPNVQTFAGARHYFTIAPDIASQFHQITHAENATLFMGLLGAFNVLLHIYSRQTDISVGTPVAGRNRNQLESTIGLFINTLVMRNQIEPQASFRDLLKQIRQTTLDGFAHQDVPFEKLVEELHPPRDPSRTPYFQHLFILQNAPFQSVELPGVTLTALQPNKASSLFDITLTMWDDDKQGMRGYLEYNTDLFSSETMARFVTHFQQLMRHIGQQPDAPIAQLSPLSRAEKSKMLVEWNATERPFPHHTFTQLFKQQAEKTPEKTAVTNSDGDLTYAQLDAKSDQLAAYLRQFDIQPDTLIGLALPRNTSMLVAILGILKAGAAYLPIDPTYPDQRIQYMLEHAQAPLLITNSELESSLPQHQAQTILIDTDWSKIEAAPALAQDFSRLNDLAYVIYTSGSTGKPKGVQITHRNLANFLHTMQEKPGICAEDTLLAVTTLSFDIATLELYLPLISGARVLLADQATTKDALLLLKLLESEPVTMMQATPATWQMLLAAGWEGKAGLKILSGGEALPVSLAQQLVEKGTAVWNMYGPTETTVWSTCLQVTAEECQTDGVVSIGTPIGNTDVYVLDDHLQPVPIGVTGNLYIGGKGVARGYLHRPDLTAERFPQHPFKPEERIYFTGDLSRYRSDGSIEFLGRSDHQVKVRGFRIELGEIENSLQQHPEIAQAVVHPQGEQLIAYLIAKGEEQPDVTALRSHVQETLPAYMVPHRFLFLEAYPLTPNGKVDRKALPDPAKFALSTDNYVPPRTPIEEALVNIWENLLNVPRVGIEDNFFELGGHSLLATQLVSRVRQTLGVELPLRSLFEAGTVAALAKVVTQAQDAPVAPRIQVVDSADAMPLSFSQQRLWVLDQIEPNLTAYHIPAVIRLEGTLDTETLQAAFNELIARHDSLRTTFAVNPDGDPIQVVHDDVPLEIPVTAVSEADVPETLKEIVKRPFDLTIPPLLRIELLQVQPDNHLLAIVIHHIIADGWSMNILVQELATLYHALRAEQPNPLPALPVQYPDFAAWQRSWLQGEVLAEQLAYWQQRLAGAPATLDLPTDFPRPAMQSYRGAIYRHDLPHDLSQHVIHFSRQANATPFMTLLATYQLLLARYSGQNDIVVGSPIANRNRTEVENLIGFFVNMLVLRAQIGAEDNFHDLLAQVRQHALDGYAHQDVPFEKLVDALSIPRDTSYSPVFQVAFILQNTPRNEIDLGEVKMSVVPAEGTTAKYDLTLTVLDTKDGGYRLLWEYCTDLFAEETIERLATHFVYLLENVLTRPHQIVSELPLFSAEEQHQMLTEWNATERPFPTHTLTQLFMQQVEKTPEKTAVSASDGNLTYAQLDAKSDQLAAYLRQFDIQPDTLVGLALPRDTSMLVAILGILKAGAAYLPIDPNYPDQRIQYMLDHAQAPLLITNAELVETLPKNEAKPILIDSDWAQIEAAKPLAQDFSRLENLAYVIYTSGSTGKPKGVQITHGNLANFLCTMREKPGICAEDTLLAVTTLSFDIATLELYLPLITGARVLLADQATTRDVSLLMKQLESEPVTIMQATPATWQMMLAAGWEGKPDLKILSGGEALPAALAKELLGRGTAVWNMYGPTETTVWSTCLQVTEAECQTDGVVSIGTPIGNTDVYVLDDHLQPVPIGVTGNLYIGGKGVARGYLHRANLTAERFPQHPFKPDKRIYFTGDLARYRKDGSIEFLGRSDHQVKVRGFRIELGEIENSLQQHSEIAQAVVHPQGEQLIAYLIAKGEEEPDVTVLRNHVQETLPAYMVPHRFLFLEAYPLTPNGKVDRKALPAPDGAALTSSKTYTAPRNEKEEQVANIWKKLLNLSQVGVHDNFFELGGDSISAIRFIAQAKEIGLIYRPSQLFQNQTVAELAALIDEQTAVPAKPLQAQTLDDTPDFNVLADSLAAEEYIKHPENIQDLYTLTPTQRAILFHTLYAPKTGVYVEQNALEMEDLDIDLYAQAWQQMIKRHDLLRTAFFWEDVEEPLQMVIRDVPFPLAVLDWRSESEERQLSHLQELMATERQKGFDLTKPPLLRLYIIQVDENRHFVLVNYHHILLDGWSNVVIHLEVRAIYDALKRGEAPNLPTPTPYHRYISWLRQQEESEAKTYWQEYLANFEEATPIPIAEQMNQGIYGAVEDYAEQSVTLSAELWDRLHTLLNEYKITYNNFMQAVWGIVLNRYSGENDVLFGTVVHGRPAELPQFDRMVGLFINVLPVRLQFQKEEAVIDWLKHSHERFVDQSQFAHNSLEQIQQWGGFPRERNLFHSLFINNNPATDNMPPPPTDSRPLFVQEKTNYALNFYLKPKEVLQITYDPTLFTAVSIKRMLTHVVQIVRNIVARPEQRMDELTILPSNERTLLLETWNNWPTPVSQGSLVTDFAAQVANQPHVAAVIDPAYGTLTYAELDEKSSQLAAHLQRLGIQNGRIGLHVQRSYHFPVGFWAILKSGNTYVPLDAKHPPQRLAFMIENAQLEAIISHSSLKTTLPQMTQPVLLIDEIEPQLANVPALAAVEMAETAVILYTSGSSGQPKGVRLPHQAVQTYMHTAVNQFQLSPSDNILQFASIGFDTSLEEICTAHLSGSTLILRTEESLNSIQAFFNFCHTYQITVLDLPTAFWHTMTIEMQRNPALQLPANIRLIIIGGEKASPEHLATWRAVASNEVTLLNTYGPTEATIVATGCAVAGPDAVSRAELAPIGKPIPSARVYIVDQYDQLAPVGVPGELLIAGPQLASGYVGLPEETAAKFIPDPFADAGKVYRTGDRVRFLDDGILHFVGRTDRQIKIRGHRIEPETLEQLLNQHEDVADTAVTTQPDSQNNLQIVAYLIPQNGTAPEQQALTNYLRQLLPAYMIPAAFVTLDSFPKTSNGKINYRALPAPTFQTQDGAQYEAPRTPIEETIADLFAQLTSVEKVGLYDNFFQLGGHSLLITQLASRIQSIFEVELSLRTLFEHPTVVDMAILVEEKMLEMVEALDDDEIDLLL